MHNHNMGGSNRPKTKTFIHRLADIPAAMRETSAGLLTREDLRHLVAAMVD